MKHTPNHITEKTPLKIIHEAVCEVFDVELDYPFQKSRKRNILFVRQFFQYIAAETNPRIDVPYRHIGSYYSENSGWKIDHSTVINNHRRIQDYVDSYPEDRIIKQKILEIIESKLK